MSLIKKKKVNSPTRVTSSSSSLIDHVLSDVDGEMLQVEVIGTGLSDHFAQAITLSFSHSPQCALSSEHNQLINDTSPTNLITFNYLLSRKTWTKNVENL